MPKLTRECGPPLFLLTCASLFISSIVFIFSMLHLGYDSFFTIPAVYAVTLIYHVTILVLEHRNSARLDPASSTTLGSIICGAAVGAMWLGAFTVVLLVTVLFGDKAIGEDNGELWILIVQCFIAPVEALVLLALVLRSAQERRQGASESWRKVEE
ncbi:uncharacterized protein EV420DRAFT_1551859 [Desarmillaria tabescens]|uniref:Uncharacterized protein n=1 Tax=Armillaria tabescens TaxID=1929756 RepID=A0AA39KC88_ARMTA|nr:uncharacterized protein EV420DRAFT_1551859 [Desarmillaria tabescens]KAK0457164.1 hypothetical protein EV420DRAFT_1551859 [Desarmillaria tabescens]